MPRGTARTASSLASSSRISARLCRAAVSGCAGERQPALASQQQVCRQPSAEAIGMEPSLARAEALFQDSRSAAV